MSLNTKDKIGLSKLLKILLLEGVHYTVIASNFSKAMDLGNMKTSSDGIKLEFGEDSRSSNHFAYVIDFFCQ